MPRIALVKPAREGLVLPMPGGADLPADGARVDVEDLFWLRRLDEGDVEIVKPEPEPEPASSDVVIVDEPEVAAPDASKKKKG